MKKVKWRSGTLLSPVPAVVVTCGTVEKPNAVTIAWTGIICSDPAKTYISVRPSRYSYDIIKQTREFVINLTTSSMVRSVDMVGIKSGRDCEDKLKLAKLATCPSTELSCPMLEDSPLTLECKVTDIIPLGSHDMFIADIVSVNVAEKLIDEKGKLHLEQASLMAYSHGDYFALGKKIGSFGFSAKKKRPKNYKPAPKK